MVHDGTRAFLERLTSGGECSRYVIISARPFLTEKERWRIGRGDFTLEELYPYLARLDAPPTEGTRWLYEVLSYEVLREHHRDQVTFADHTMNFSSRRFSSFDATMRYVQETFGADMSEFRKEWQTNMPQM
jgi:hypothetical protein